MPSPSINQLLSPSFKKNSITALELIRFSLPIDLKYLPKHLTPAWKSDVRRKCTNEPELGSIIFWESRIIEKKNEM